MTHKVDFDLQNAANDFAFLTEEFRDYLLDEDALDNFPALDIKFKILKREFTKLEEAVHHYMSMSNFCNGYNEALKFLSH